MRTGSSLPSHRATLQTEPAYANRPLQWFVGRDVKAIFRSPTSQIEHLWVTITHTEQDRLAGTLPFRPMIVEHLRCGDVVTLTRRHISAVALSLEEWTEEAAQLQDLFDYSNDWLGLPTGPLFETWYYDFCTPRQALRQWRQLSSESQTGD